MMRLQRMLGRAVLTALCLGAVPQVAHAQASPLVVVGQDDGQNAGGFTEVKKRKSSDDGDSDGGGKKWFAFWFPDDLKPELEEKKWALAIVGMLFGAVGGALWAPLVLGGATFDLEWALPSLIYSILCTAFSFIWILSIFPYIGWYTFWIWFPLSFIGGIVFAGLAVFTGIANLNRPEIELDAGDSGSSKKKKKKSRRSDDDDDE